MDFDGMTLGAIKNLKKVVVDKGIKFTNPRAKFLKEVKDYADKLAKATADESFNQIAEAADKLLTFFGTENDTLIKEVKKASGISTRTKKTPKAPKEPKVQEG